MNRSGIITLVILALLLVVVFAFYFNIQKNNQKESLETSPVASVINSGAEYTDINGNRVSLSDYLGHTIVAFAWASWCPSCIEQLKLLGSMSEQNEDVIVLAFNRSESLSTAKNFLAFYNLETKVELIMDPNDHFFTSIKGYSMPETVIFDAKGNIKHHERGPISKDELSYILQN